MGKQRHTDRTAQMLTYVFLALAAIVVMIPFYWLIVQSLKSRGEMYTYPPTLLPRAWAWGNYAKALTDPLFFRSYLNSIIVTGCQVFFGVISCSMAGYAFAKFSFRFRGLLFAVILVSMMIPFHVVVIPLYLEIKKMGLWNTLPGVILPFIARPFGVFFMRQYLTRIPDELLEAARMDGASEFYIWGRIVLPLSTPACGVLACIFFVEDWNILLWPLIVLQGETQQTLQVYLQGLIGVYNVDFGALFAGAVLAILPIFILFLSMQKQIVSGLTAGAVKS
jgi:ABC-type glycerol-3-phosphate transport system permease component